MLPEGWTIQRLQTVAPVVDCKHRTPKYAAVGIPIVSPGNLRTGPLQLDECRRVSSEDHTELMNHCSVKIGDLVFGRNQSVGVSSVVVDDRPFAIGQDTVLIQPRKIHADFLYQWMQSPDLALDIRRLLGGSTFGRINLKDLRHLLVPTPPKHEARKIAEILSTWDRAIAAVEKLIANARTQKTALMQQLLTGTKRLPGFDGDWTAMRLDELAKVTMGSSPPSWAYNDIGQGLPLVQGNADIADRLTAPRFWTSEVTQTCDVGDVIFSVRAPVGEIAKAVHCACLGRGVAGIRPRSSSDAPFLYQALINAEEQWAKLSQGSTFQAINSRELKGFKLNVPVAADERTKIGVILHDASLAEDNLIRQADALRQEKSALMQQLLTGKRRVTIDAPATTHEEAAA